MLNLTYRATNVRSEYLGASEAPAILGLSPWSTPFDVWARKKGYAEPFQGNEATRRGHRLEGVVLQWGAEEVGADEVVSGGDFDSCPVQGPLPHMAFHPDGWVRHGDEWVLVEVKTARFGDGWEDDGIPAVYAAQVAYQLACCPPEVKRAYVFAFITGKDEWLVREVERKEAIEDAFVTRCAEWWSRFIIGDETPALDGSDAAGSYLTQKYGRQTTLMEDATPDEARTVDELMALRATIKRQTAYAKRLEQIIKDHIGQREGVFVPEVGKVSWRWQRGRATFDRKRFEQDHPELAAQYTKTGPEQRVLRLPVGASDEQA